MIGYNSLNIFYIWISKINKIICIKDVIFDETFFYNSNDVNFNEIIKNLILEIYKSEFVMIQQFLIMKINSDNIIEMKNKITKLYTLKIQILEI